MAKKEQRDIIEILRGRKLTCAKLKSMEQRELKDSRDFRKVGFNEIAKSNENSANKIKVLRKRVCKLR